jgi:biopolymer transport protein ExbD
MAMCRDKIRLGLFALVLVTVNACSGDDFAQAANQYCNLYSSEPLGFSGESAGVQAVFGSILERQTSIKNENLQDILKSSDSSSFSNYYASVKEKIEAELGHAWSCDSFDQFFLPKQKVISLSLIGVKQKAIDPHDENVITIMLAHSGEILVNGAPLKEISKLKAAIESRTAKRPISQLSFVLYFDEGSKGELVSDVMIALAELGVVSVDLIDM